MRAESSGEADDRLPSELVSPKARCDGNVNPIEDVGMQEEIEEEEEMEDRFGDERETGEEEDPYGFGPDLNREAVWEELERRGRESVGQEREGAERGLSHEVAPGRVRGEIHEEPKEEEEKKGDEEEGA